MSKYFEGVDFPELEEPKPVPAPPKDACTEVDWTPLMTEVRRMIAAIGTGQSLIVRGAVTVPPNSPLFKAIEGLEQVPSLDSLKHFLKIAEQDLTTRFKQEVLKVFHQTKAVDTILKENEID